MNSLSNFGEHYFSHLQKFTKALLIFEVPCEHHSSVAPSCVPGRSGIPCVNYIYTETCN